MGPTLVWFRLDLRLQDNAALHAALARGGPVIPVYVFAEPSGSTSRGTVADWWLRQSLRSLGVALHERGSRLVIAHGPAPAVLARLVAETGAAAVYWNDVYLPTEFGTDSRVRAELSAGGVEVRSFSGRLLHEPSAIMNRSGRPFQVFGAFWRHCLVQPVAAPLKLPAGNLPAPSGWPVSVESGGDGAPAVDRFAAHWEAGESAATRRLASFVRQAMENYATDRDRPAVDGTSRLSPALHFGEISPRQIWAAVRARGRSTGLFPPSNGARVFLAELGWREFAAHLLVHFPHTLTQPLRPEFARFPWAADPGRRRLRAWQSGQTGYPMVDAGMRQLAATGWMHNRVRMITASFLTKHLRLPWTEGARWFAEQLLDADPASNTLGWQWTAGCGADAAPYFRIFAPVLQGRRFDPAGEYVRRWIPELAGLPVRHLHAPWAAPADLLARAGVRLGETYPAPVVDHATARREALEAFRSLRAGPRLP